MSNVRCEWKVYATSSSRILLSNLSDVNNYALRVNILL